MADISTTPSRDPLPKTLLLVSALLVLWTAAPLALRSRNRKWTTSCRRLPLRERQTDSQRREPGSL